jgi:deoxyuridine 5'-triphosphate nucleotidohydrolase
MCFADVPKYVHTSHNHLCCVAINSGLAVKKMIDCGAGVVDADYRGNVGVVLFNFGTEDFHVEIGDRIAQLILEQISMVPAVKVDELTETERGAGGFGSTGVKGEPVQKMARTISPTGEVEKEA